MSKRLKLCLAHKQEPNQSHFDPTNCDYCKLLALHTEGIEVVVRLRSQIAALCAAISIDTDKTPWPVKEAMARSKIWLERNK